MTPADIEAEYWAHHYFENPNAVEDVDDSFDLDAAVSAGEDWETLL